MRSTTTNTNTNTNNLQQPYYSLNRYMLEVRSLRVYFSTISSDSFYSFVFVAAGGRRRSRPQLQLPQLQLLLLHYSTTKYMLEVRGLRV